MSKQISEPQLSIRVDTGELSVQRRSIEDPLDRRMLDPAFARAYRSWLDSIRQPGEAPKAAYGG